VTEAPTSRAKDAREMGHPMASGAPTGRGAVLAVNPVLKRRAIFRRLGGLPLPGGRSLIAILRICRAALEGQPRAAVPTWIGEHAAFIL
jgi:hypothetical protein